MFHGSMAALVTPMHPSGEIDLSTVSDLVELQIDAGTHALVVGGSTGEGATLMPDEKLMLLEHVVAQANDRISVIFGAQSNHIDELVTQLQSAMALGAEAALVTTPVYIRPSQEGLYQYYRKIAKSVALPIILYNVPSRTASDLLPETVARLSQMPNIVGLKETTSDLSRLLALQDLCGDSIDLYSGDDLTAKNFMLLGGKGVISVVANIAPQLMSELSEAALVGDRERATAIHHRLLPLCQACAVESNPIPLKWAMHALNLIPEGIRLPLTPLSEAFQPMMWAALQHAGLVDEVQSVGEN